MPVFSCERIGTEYPPEYVPILFDMVTRNLPEWDGRFICFTDQTDEFAPPIQCLPLSERDNYPERINLSLNWLILGGLDDIAARGSILEEDRCYYWGGDFPKNAKIAECAGAKPHELDGWVKDVWKIGGGTPVNITFDSSSRIDEIANNIRAAHEREGAKWVSIVEAHSQEIVIVTGGPSVADNLDSIRTHKAMGAYVLACSGVAKMLLENGIRPDAHMILDSSPLCVAFVPNTQMRRYYASQCDRHVLDAAGDDLVLFDGYMQNIEQITPKADGPYVGGGTTVGTRSIGLAYLLGYRRIHCYGLDSSYTGEMVHSYHQWDYPTHLTVTFDGKEYRTSPQLAAQVSEFQQMVPELVAHGVELFIHGTGLLPDVARSMVNQPKEVT